MKDTDNEETLPFDYIDDDSDYEDDVKYYFDEKKSDILMDDMEKCPDCGYILEERVERHPYGDTYAIEYFLVCPNCE